MIEFNEREFQDLVNSLIGTPYDAQNFHCWTLVEKLVPNAPKLNVIGGNYQEAVKQFKERTPDYINQINEITEDARTLDIVLAGHNSISHAGVLYLDSKNVLVIHNDEKGVHIESIQQFSKKFKTIRLLRC